MNEYENRLAELLQDMVGIMKMQSEHFHDNMCKIIDALERLELRMIVLQDKFEELAKLKERGK